MLRLCAVVLGAPQDSCCIEASPGDDISTLQGKVKSENPNTLGSLDSAKIIIWKVVVVYSNVLFKLLLTFT